MTARVRNWLGWGAVAGLAALGAMQFAVVGGSGQWVNPNPEAGVEYRAVMVGPDGVVVVPSNGISTVLNVTSTGTVSAAEFVGDGRDVYIPTLHDIPVKGAFTSFQTWPGAVEKNGELFMAYVDPGAGEQRVARWASGGKPEVKTVGPWGDDNHNAPAILWFGDAWHVALSEHGVTSTNYYGRFSSFDAIGSITASTNAFDTGGSTTYNQLQDFHGRLYHWFRSNPGYKYRYSDDNGDTWSSVALWAENPQHPTWHFYWKIREGLLRDELLAIHSYNSSDATSDYWDMRAGAVRYESGEHRLYYDDTTYETLDASLAGNAMTNWTEVMPSSMTETYVAWDIRDTDLDDGIGVVYVGRDVDYTNSMTYSYAYGDLGGSFRYEDICQADGYIAYEGTRPIVGRAAFDRRKPDVIAVWVAQAGSGDDSPRIERYVRTAADTWTLTDTIGPMPGYGWAQGPLVPHDSDKWSVVGHRYETYTDYDTFDGGYLWAIGSSRTAVGSSLGRGALDADGRIDIPATDYGEPVIRLYHEAYGVDSANLGLHQSRIRFTHYNGSGVSLEVATTNVGTWASGGGDIVFRPGDSYDALRIDRLGEHAFDGNLDITGDLFSDGYIRGTQARVAGAVFDPGPTNVEGVAVISSSQSPGIGNFGTPIDFTVFGDNATKKASIVPWQYGADEDQLGLAIFSSVSATKSADIVPAVWIFGPNGRVSGYWIVTGNVTSVSGQFNGSGAGLTNLDASKLSGVIPVAVRHAPYKETISASHTLTASECYNGAKYWVVAAATLEAPVVAEDMEFIVWADGPYVVSVDPNSNDRIKLDGVALDDGDKITSDGTPGAMAIISHRDPDGWYATTDGHWSDGGP